MGIERDHWLMNAFRVDARSGVPHLYYKHATGGTSTWRVFVDSTGRVFKWNESKPDGWFPVCNRFADLMRLIVEFHHGD